MKKITSEWQSELLEKVDLEQLVGEYVPLTHKGGRLWGCCPFHNEKTPSFTVSNEKGFYKCFGCGKSGNAIGFIMEMQHLSFPEACQFLADRVGMTPPSFENATGYEEEKKLKEHIYEINREAANFFAGILSKPEGKPALDYFSSKRGFSDNVLKHFGLGYADASWDSLFRYLTAKGYSASDIEKAGLCRTKDDSHYDFFRNRPIIPIINQFDKVIAFGGRALSEEDSPKYLNSPDTPVFNKRRNLYNLNNVWKMRDLSYVILAEGYMDVISLVSYGFANTVATLGTALTPEQARLLSKRVKKVYVSYDGDGAGQNAILKAIDILHEAGIEPQAVVIPDGRDPDEFLREYGAEAYKKLMAKSMSRIDYKLHTEKLKVDFKTTKGREDFLFAALRILANENSPIIREKYTRLLSKATGFSEETIKAELGEAKTEDDGEYTPKTVVVAEEKPQVSEQFILSMLIRKPEAAELLEKEFGITEDDFVSVSYAKVYSAIRCCIRENVSVTGAEILARLQGEDDRVKLVATELLETDADTIAPGAKKDSFLLDCIRSMKKKKADSEKKQLLAKLAEAQTPEEKEELRNKINDLIRKKF